jgi:hypothetical protein
MKEESETPNGSKGFDMGSELRRARTPFPSFTGLPNARGKARSAPAAILATWTAIEALSPATYDEPHDLVFGRRKLVARFKDGPLPWTTAEQPPPGKQLFYRVVLGSILMEPTTKALI